MNGGCFTFWLKANIFITAGNATLACGYENEALSN
jgi:hypothetical protein